MHLLISIYWCFLFGLADETVCIKGDGYYGYIFNKENDAFLSVKDQEEKYTPTKEEIQLLEEKLRVQIPLLNREETNQGKGCPVIHKKLSRYVRQYFGFINRKGDKIIFINFVWAKSDNKLIERLSKDYVEINDGCSRYWRIKYNLTQGEFYEFRVNPKA